MKRKSSGTPSGFRDLLSEDVSIKNWLVNTISDVYKKWGFLPIETPVVEFTETLAGEVTDFNLFSVVPSKERQTGIAQSLSLRFDHTVPLARFVVDNMNKITLPFKRYVCGPVFRGETAQIEKGRYRQFDQFDLDIVGSSNISSDIEVLLCMHETMKAVVGKNKFIIRTNTRKLLNCLPALFDFSESSLKAVLIELDKRDKVTSESLISSLTNIGLTQSSAEKLSEFGSIYGSPEVVLKKIEEICGGFSEATEAISDLKIVSDTVNSCGINEIIFDMSVIRGLGYYTGMVFETTLIEAQQFGSVYSGGRYDGLVSNFGVQPLPAVGASVGVDRLVAALQSMDFKIPSQFKKAIVLIQDPIATSYGFKVAEKLRISGLTCEVYTGIKKKLSDQFAYADKLNYDYTVVVGLNEMQNETIDLKNQKTRVRETICLSNFVLNN